MQSTMFLLLLMVNWQNIFPILNIYLYNVHSSSRLFDLITQHSDCFAICFFYKSVLMFFSLNYSSVNVSYVDGLEISPSVW